MDSRILASPAFTSALLEPVVPALQISFILLILSSEMPKASVFVLAAYAGNNNNNNYHVVDSMPVVPKFIECDALFLEIIPYD